MASALEKLEARLKILHKKNNVKKYYHIPSLWLTPKIEQKAVRTGVNPFEFFRNRIKKIRDLGENAKISLPESDWATKAVVYNMLPRYSAAYDHDDNQIIDIGIRENGFRETGTLLKAIAMLPYIHSLGANTIYFLPITSIGVDGRKGTLGSPYAIKNPYKIDENLDEPILKMDLNDQMAAFVEAAHILGMKVIVEFVFRTASIDSDLALEHPEWFYWIKSSVKYRNSNSENENKYGPPIFTEKELKEIKAKIKKEDLKNLIPPHKEYKKLFSEIPVKSARVGSKIRGLTIDKTEVKIPSAFCDWPPDDPQPLWSDVTYLRLYDHREFNYIAYNTVRMYDKRLERTKNIVENLWDNICNIIPHYQRNFGIDGVMIDMGHALPSKLRSEIVAKAREKNKNFVFWEENFGLTQKSVDEGYSAVVGYLCFDQHLPLKLKEFYELLEIKGSPIPFFATPETHNTHRAAERPGGVKFSKIAFVINCFMPGILFIHSGYELGETTPANTGLGFEKEELLKYPVQILPLFSDAMLNWENENQWTIFMKKAVDVRNKYLDITNNFSKDSFRSLTASNENIVAFSRPTKEKGVDFIVIANMHPEKELYFSVKLAKEANYFRDVFKEKGFLVKNREMIISLKPMDFFAGELRLR